MGTNYYVVKNGPSINSAIHIGKSSGGWLFNFQKQNEPFRDPPVVWSSYPEVMNWLYRHTVEDPQYVIMDEYEEIVPYDAFEALVQQKQRDPFCHDNPDNFSWSENVGGYRFSSGEFS